MPPEWFNIAADPHHIPQHHLLHCNRLLLHHLKEVLSSCIHYLNTSKYIKEHKFCFTISMNNCKPEYGLGRPPPPPKLPLIGPPP
jgi:hypothetical protein